MKIAHRLMVAMAMVLEGIIGVRAVAQAGAATSATAMETSRPHESAPTDQTTPGLLEAAVASGELDRGTADLLLAYALTGDARLPEKFIGWGRWSGTLAHAQLTRRANQARSQNGFLSTSSLGSVAIYTKVSALLSNTCSQSWDGAQSLPDAQTSAHFYIQYDASLLGGGLTVQDYIAALETSWDTEIGTFGFVTPPIKTANPPPGGKYFVRINGLPNGVYAITSDTGDYGGDPNGNGIFDDDNPNSPWTETHARASCMIFNQNFGSLTSMFPHEALSSTVAHELFHAIQYGLGAVDAYNITGSARDIVLIEGSTTALEDEVFDASNDNARSFGYPSFATCLADDENTADAYASWLWWRALIEPFGHGIAGGSEQVLQDFYEVTGRNPGVTHMDALKQALANKGATLAVAYHSASIALKVMRPCGGSYVHPTCMSEAATYVATHGNTPVTGAISSVGISLTTAVQDNYGSNWTQMPVATANYIVTVTNSSVGGALRASFVCDTGANLVITDWPGVLTSGQSAAVTVAPAGCASTVLVVTNESSTASAPVTCAARSMLIETNRMVASPTPVPTATTPPTGVRQPLPHTTRSYFIPVLVR